MPILSNTHATTGTHHTTSTRTHSRSHAMSPVFMATNALIWISAVIVMGISSYWISLNNRQPDFIIYQEVIAVLTVVFFLGAFFLGALAGTVLLFNLIFSYLWIVAVAFNTQAWTYSRNQLGQTVEAFSYIAFFLMLFNILYDWHVSFRGSRVTSHV